MPEHVDVKRILLLSALTIVVLVVAVISLVGVRAHDAEPCPAPDPGLLIELSDGSRLPLAEVLDRARQGTLPRMRHDSPVEPLGVESTAEASLATTDPPNVIIVNGEMLPNPDPILALADQARNAGRYDEAIALYLSIPPESHRYARARRVVAWNILTKALDRPEQAVRYANEAMHADPLDGNVWQDWVRVYGRTLGLPID